MSEMIKDQETSSEQGNAGRRRLVRGVVAFAPLVLTLRSGAVAAVSCTGAVAIGTLTPVSNGNGTRYKFNPGLGGNTPQTGQVCVTTPAQCSEYATGPNPHLKISGGEKNGAIQLQPDQNGYLYCDGTGYSANQPVAILSATAAGSLFPPGG